METNNELVTVAGLARRLHLPAAWLKTEAAAGRVPCLRAGRRLLFNAEAVQRVLLDRAAGQSQKGVSDE